MKKKIKFILFIVFVVMIIAGTAIVTTQCNRKSNEEIKKENEEYLQEGQEKYNNTVDIYLKSCEQSEDLRIQENIYTATVSVDEAVFSDKGFFSFLHNTLSTGKMNLYLDVNINFFYPNEKIIRNNNNQYGKLQINYDASNIFVELGEISTPYLDDGKRLDKVKLTEKGYIQILESTKGKALQAANSADYIKSAEKSLIVSLLNEVKSYSISELYLNNTYIKDINSINIDTFADEFVK